MEQIVTGVIVALISGVILSWFGIGNSRATVTVRGGHSSPKKWKILIIVGWLLFVGGGYYCIAWASTVGFTDPRPSIGLSVGFLGFIILLVGKFGAWWNN